MAVESETPWFVRGTGALLVASASGPSLDALQPTAIGYCQDTTGGVGALASFVTTSHNLAPLYTEKCLSVGKEIFL